MSGRRHGNIGKLRRIHEHRELPLGLLTNLDTPFSLSLFLRISSSLVSLFRSLPLTKTATYDTEVSLGTSSESYFIGLREFGVSEFLMTRETPLDAYKRIYLLLGFSGTRSFGWLVDLLNETGSRLPTWRHRHTSDLLWRENWKSHSPSSFLLRKRFICDFSTVTNIRKSITRE